MGSLEELRKLVAEMFEKSTNKEDIEALSAIKTACDGVEAEHNKLQEENKELLKDYKTLITHTSFKDKPGLQETISGTGNTLDDALQIAINEFKKK